MASQDGPGGGAGDAPLIQYPLEYVFKIMGLAGDDFADHARGLVERVLGQGTAPAERAVVRQSAGGKYHSVSVTAVLASEDQRRAIYELLRADARVVYYL